VRGSSVFMSGSEISFIAIESWAVIWELPLSRGDAPDRLLVDDVFCATFWLTVWSSKAEGESAGGLLNSDRSSLGSKTLYRWKHGGWWLSVDDSGCWWFLTHFRILSRWRCFLSCFWSSF
jgi:hypothetical protein